MPDITQFGVESPIEYPRAEKAKIGGKRYYVEIVPDRKALQEIPITPVKGKPMPIPLWQGDPPSKLIRKK